MLKFEKLELIPKSIGKSFENKQLPTGHVGTIHAVYNTHSHTHTHTHTHTHKLSPGPLLFVFSIKALSVGKRVD